LPALRRISPAAAKRLFGAPVLGACALVTAVALALVGTDPGVMPGPTVLVFHHHLAALSGALFAMTLAGVMVRVRAPAGRPRQWRARADPLQPPAVDRGCRDRHDRHVDGVQA
jgi:hypothetical protein